MSAAGCNPRAQRTECARTAHHARLRPVTKRACVAASQKPTIPHVARAARVAVTACGCTNRLVVCMHCMRTRQTRHPDRTALSCAAKPARGSNIQLHPTSRARPKRRLRAALLSNPGGRVSAEGRAVNGDMLRQACWHHVPISRLMHASPPAARRSTSAAGHHARSINHRRHTRVPRASLHAQRRACSAAAADAPASGSSCLRLTCAYHCNRVHATSCTPEHPTTTLHPA
jgi:hypothetical protein